MRNLRGTPWQWDNPSPWRQARKNGYTRGFTSMTAYSKLSGFRANWQLQPPSTFRVRNNVQRRRTEHLIFLIRQRQRGRYNDASRPYARQPGRGFPWSRPSSRCPFLSRMTSNSISFQPEIHFSTRICVMGDKRRPFSAISSQLFYGFGKCRRRCRPACRRDARSQDSRFSSAKASASGTLSTTSLGMQG